jgi:hypothetical protein
MSDESWLDKQIRLAQERGDFDNLPGTGQSLPDHGQSYDEQWWLKSYLRREGVPTEALLPPPLKLRKEIERLPGTVRDLPSEFAVRQAVDQLNRRIADWLRNPSGPRITVSPVNADKVVDRWRAERPSATPAPAESAVSHRRAAWWRRKSRRRSEID